MRMNVYAEEMFDNVFDVSSEGTTLRRRIELVTKTVGDKTFYGVRIYLKSAVELHCTADDDDRSAITFWSRSKAYMAFMRACELIERSNSRQL